MISPLADGRRDSLVSTLVLALSVVALGHALQISSGTLHPTALRWLSVGLALCVIGVVTSRYRPGSVTGRWGELLLYGVVLGGLALQLLQLAFASPTFSSRSAPGGPFRAALVSVAILAVLGVARIPGVRAIWFPVVLIIHATMSSWIIHSNPRPLIDVYLFQRNASAALFAGENPYTLPFPDIYGPSSGFYGPGLTVDGWLTFGFPYFPLSLLLVMPAQLIAGDFRYAHALAVTCGGALIGYARPGPLAMTAACLYLFTPRVFHILHQGWTEPLVVLLCAATIFCGCRATRALPYVYGLFVAVKQYLVWIVPLAYVLAAAARLDLRTLLVRGLLVSTAVTLPFFLWDPGPFIESVITLQFHQPFRPDALSYLAWVATRGGPVLPGWLAFAAAILALLLASALTVRTPAGTAAAMAFVYFVFFAFSKQAFANYYFFVVGALCCAVGAAQFEPDESGHPDG